MMDLGEGSKHSIGVCGAFLIRGNISKSFEEMSERVDLIFARRISTIKRDWDESTKIRDRE